jgi:hypothetical protein
MLGAYTLRGDSCLECSLRASPLYTLEGGRLGASSPFQRRLVSLSKAPRLPFKGVSSDSRRLARRRRDRSHGMFSTELKDDWRVVGRAA